MAVIEKLPLSVLPQNLYNELPTAQCIREDLTLKRFIFFINRCCNCFFGVESKSALLILQQYREPVNDYSLGPG